MKKLVRELDLTQAQRAPIEEILGHVQADLWKFRKQHRQEVESIIVLGIAQMKPHLSAVQQEKLDSLFQKLKARWEHAPDGSER